MSPDNPQTSFYPIYLILFPHQHFLKYAFPHALNFTIMFFFLLYRGPMIQRESERPYHNPLTLALMLTYCLDQGKLFNFADTQLSIL